MLHISKLLEKHHLSDIKASDANGNTILHLALKNEELREDEKNQILNIAINKDVSPNAVDIDGNTALHVAIIKSEYIDIIELLIERTININHKNSEGNTPFNIVIFKWTSLRGPQIGDDMWLEESPELKKIPANDCMEIIDSLIDKEVDVNVQDNNGMSPLCFAIEKYHLMAVDLLRENNADFNVTLPNGESLLHLLVKYRYSLKTDEEKIKLFDVLISNGCKINARDKSGNTALHLVAKMGHVVIAQKLVENGAELNCKNNLGETPLCCLDYIFDPEEYSYEIEDLLLDDTYDRRDHYNKMLEILFKHGADFTEQVLNGYSILRIAVWRIYRKESDSSMMKLRLEMWKGYRLDGNDELTLPDIRPEEIQSLTEFLRNYNRNRINCLLIHWVRLEAANLQCNTTFEYENLMEEEEYKKIDEKCREEIKKLKDYFINSRTSLYTLLHMDLNRRRAYINNEKLQKLLQSPKLEEEFPEYSVLIFASYREAITRKSLMDPAKNAWLELTKIKLPEICIELIFSFLNNAEMFDFIDKSKSTD